jgi:Secretion system C-terminal sorting domain/FG-GAP repeat
MKKTTFLGILCMLLTTIATAQWAQMGADIDGEAADDFSGGSVSVSADGNTVAIGAYWNDGNGNSAGHVRIYHYNDTTWTQVGSDIDGEAADDWSGHSVSVSSDGNTVAIGAHYNDGYGADAGHVRIYHYNGTTWTQQGADIDGEAAFDQSGYSVSLSSDGNTVAIGARYNDGNGSNAGHVRIYYYNGAAWTQVGTDIDGEAVSDYSGWSVSLSSDGNTVAIGAMYNDGNGSSSGHVRIYKYNGTVWTQLGADINGEVAGDQSGCSVSLSSDGNTVAIGADYNADNGFQAGHVRIYHYNGTTWTQLGIDIDGEAAGDGSGSSVSVSSDGNTVAIGAPQNDGNAHNAGHVRIYNYNGTVWILIGADIDGEAIGNQSGCSVSVSSDGNTVAIGAYANDGNGTDAGHVRIYTCNTFDTIVEIACDTFSSPSGNYAWTNSGNYKDTIPNAFGADSIITIDLTVNYSNTGIDVQTACDSLAWIDGNTYYASNNIATHTLSNAAGCDSVVTLDLRINSNTGIDLQTACDSLLWIDGNTYYTSNTTATDTLSNAAGCDSVVTLDLTVNHSNTGIDVQTACFSYLWIDGNTFTSSNNTAMHTLTNAVGCDSVVTLDLTINTIDVSVTLSLITNGITLTATLSGATYQWIDCNNGDLPIAGETNQSFTTTVDGSYAVIIDDGTCIDTSVCTDISGIGINDDGIASAIAIYPNPTTGKITVECEGMERVEVLDITGKLIYEIASSLSPRNDVVEIDISGFSKGLYFVRVSTQDGVGVERIVLE